MSYYVREVHGDNGVTTQAWEITEMEAVRLGVTNARQGPGCYYIAHPGEDIFDAIRRQTPWFAPNGENPFHRITLEPGEYYPRIARPTDSFLNESPGHNPAAQAQSEYIAIAVSQLTALTEQLRHICQTVHPVGNNLNAFGHDIRNLLILGCTEVETHWRGVLEANGMQLGRYSTKDYYKLRNAMRLNEYEVSFFHFPWLNAVSPFRSWDAIKPTESLVWYDAYNAVKHNREKEFSRATLQNLFESISACAIMMIAQFGLYVDGWRNSEPAKFFQFRALPKWEPKDVYMSPYPETARMRKSVMFPF
jgi:hypothetical protein